MNIQQDSRSVGVTDSLDGLRGILAIWVVLSHVTQLVAGPEGLITRGGIAVDLFMLVSGFLMVWTVSSRETKEPIGEGSTWKKFFVRRILRIAPLYFLLLVPGYIFSSQISTMFVDVYAALGQNFIRPFRECGPATVYNVLLHLTFLFGLFPCTSSNNILPDWSLSLEMQFYAVFPLLFLLIVRWKGGALLLAILGALIAGLSQHFISISGTSSGGAIIYPQPSLLPLRINCFIAGMALALLLWRQSRDLMLLVSVLVSVYFFQRLSFMAISTVLILMFLSRFNLWLRWEEGYCWPLRRIEAFLTAPPLRFLGDISFGVYLVHFLILLPMVATLNEVASFRVLSGNDKFILVSLLILPSVLFVSWLLHRWIEKPMIDLGRALTAANRFSK